MRGSKTSDTYYRSPLALRSTSLGKERVSPPRLLHLKDFRNPVDAAGLSSPVRGVKEIKTV